MTGRTGTAVQFVAGVVALVVVAEFIGRSGLLGPSWPALSTVVATLVDPARRDLFSQALLGTAWEASWGLVLGSGTALVLASARQTLRLLRDGLDRFAATVHAVPGIGIAPVLIVCLGRSNAPVAVAALAAFFPAYIAASAALGAVAPVHDDLFTVMGSSKPARFLRLRLPTALPGLLDALRLAAPGAFLGAILGEWFGAPSGLGLVIVSSAQNFQVALLWAAALLATGLALLVFGAFSGLQALARRRFA